MKRRAMVGAAAAALGAVPLLTGTAAVAQPRPGSAPLARPAAAVPPLEVSVSLRGEGLEHLMTPDTKMDCTGGTWAFDWAGRVPGETASSTALLAGDGMFFTPELRAGWLRPPVLQGPGIRCTVPDGSTGRPRLAFEGRIARHPHASVDVQVSMESANPYLSIAVSDAAVCRVQLPPSQTVELPVPLNIRSGQPTGPGTARFHRPVSFTREELDRGFSKTWQVSAQGFAVGASQCMGQNMQGEVTLRWKAAADDPQIDFAACLHLARGESRAVEARGTPPGGRYQFGASPPSLVDASPSGGTFGQTRVSAQAPGLGEFTARYTAVGKSASKTVPASVVDVQGFDAPQILEIGLMDADGKPRPPVKLPFRSQPAAAGDLLVFKAFDPQFVGLATGASEITLQGVRPGTTGIRAETLCGTPVGPIQTVKVVTCDPATREALERRKRSARERNDAISRRVTELLTDDEFLRVEREIEDDTKNLAIKAGESIVGTLALGQGERLSAVGQRLGERGLKRAVLRRAMDRQQAVELAGNIYDIYDTAMDTLEGYEALQQVRAGDRSGADAYDSLAKGALALAAKIIDNDAIGLGKSYGEAILAAQKMGRNLGVLAGVADQLADLDLQHDDVRLEWEHVAGLLRRCDTQIDRSEVELNVPPAGPRPPVRPRPPRPTPVEIEVPPPAAGPLNPPATPPSVLPPSRPPASVRVGLPLCLAADATPAAVAASLRGARSVNEAYLQRLQQRRSVAEGPTRWAEALRAAVGEGPAAVRERAPALRRQLDQAILDLAADGSATVEYLERTERCPAELPLRAVDLRRIEWSLGP